MLCTARSLARLRPHDLAGRARETPAHAGCSRALVADAAAFVWAILPPPPPPLPRPLHPPPPARPRCVVCVACCTPVAGLRFEWRAHTAALPALPSAKHGAERRFAAAAELVGSAVGVGFGHACAKSTNPLTSLPAHIRVPTPPHSYSVRSAFLSAPFTLWPSCGHYTTALGQRSTRITLAAFYHHQQSLRRTRAPVSIPYRCRQPALPCFRYSMPPHARTPARPHARTHARTRIHHHPNRIATNSQPTHSCGNPFVCATVPLWIAAGTSTP